MVHPPTLMFSGRSYRFLFTISQGNRFVIRCEKTGEERCPLVSGTRRTFAEAVGKKSFFAESIFCENDLKQEKIWKMPCFASVGKS